MKKNSIYFLIEQAKKGQKEELPPSVGATTITPHEEETTVAGSEGDEREGRREAIPSVIGLSGNMVKNPAMLLIEGGKQASEEVLVLDLKPKKTLPKEGNQEQRGASNENRIKAATSNLSNVKHPVPLKSI
jgi:hypothetical protein